MQLEKAERKNYNAQSSRFTQRIGSTIFTVNLHHGTPKSESLEEKILRMMKNDLKTRGQSAIITIPQADPTPTKLRFAGTPGRLPERGSL